MSDNLANQGPTYRVPRGGMDPATKRLALIAAGLGGALFVVLGVWSTVGGHSGAVPVIAPPSGPVRVKPANPGGLKIANDLILSGRQSDAGGDKLAPAPEAPDPQALKLPQAPAPAAASPAQPLVADQAGSSLLPMPPPLAPAPPNAAVAAPAVAVAAAVHADAGAPSGASSGAPSGAVVQLAALPTRQEADAEWQLLAHRNAPLLAGRTPSFSEAMVSGRSWWRVRTGGFADAAEARAFCDKFRAAGGACSVVRF